MKILMLNYEFPPIGGGAANANLYLLKQYAGIEDLQVDVLTSAPKPGFSEEKFADNIKIYKVGIHKKHLHYWRKPEVIEWLIKAGPVYRKLISQNDYKIAHAFFGFPTGWLCYRNADKLAFMISLRGSDVPGYNVRLGLDYKILAGLFRRIWSSADMIIANSIGLKNLSCKFMPELDIKVIPNGIDTNKFYPAKTTLIKPIKLLTVCRLIKRKRIELLIEAILSVKSSGLDVELNIVGDGNLMSELKSLTQKLGIANQVNFFGRIESEQMPDIYRSNNIFVMASQHEGMSNAMLEALACGLPIITTRCEGVEELIDKNGIIVEQADSKSISEAIKKLAADNQQLNQMSLAAVEKAKEYSWDSAAQKYLQLYKELSGKEVAL